MDDLFGVSMTAIMLVLVALLGVSLAVVGYVVLRNRIMFMVGVRNMPRRPAQTVLIILGLMLSTLIISAAFTTGDTVDHSLTSGSYNLLGHVDHIVQKAGEQRDAPRQIDSFIPADVYEPAVEAARRSGAVDGVLPMIMQELPVVNERSRQSEPGVTLAGVDPGSLDGFPDIVSTSTGAVLGVDALTPGQVYLNESGADDLDAEAGDTLQVFVEGQPHQLEVVDIVRDRMVAGVGGFEVREGIVMPLDRLQELLGREGQVSFIAVSGEGGVREGYETSDAAVLALRQGFSDAGLALSLDVYDVKRDLVDMSAEAGNFMATFFLIFGLFSIAAGMLLIVMIFVMLAAERKPELGMARAVGTKRGHLVQMFLSEGMAYNVLSAMVGAALGVGVALGIANIMGRIFSEFNFSIEPTVNPRSLVISYSLGVVLTFLTVTFASWRVSNLNIVRAIRDIPEPAQRGTGRRWLVAGLGGIVLGALLIWAGMNANQAFPFALGFSLATAGLALVLRYAGLPDRPVFTAAGLLVLVLWGLTAGQRLEALFGELQGDIEMFFLSGIAMVTASTFVLVFNADIVLAVVSRFGGLFSTVLPAMRTAVAYPLAAKFRTGMTLAMISLVIFALTMMSMMNSNFERLFLADSARGGWDVIVDENPVNPIDDLPGALETAGSDAAASFGAVGRASLAGESSASNAGETDYTSYPVFGVDDGFVRANSIRLSGRAEGFESDAEVWQALATREDVAIVDAFTVEQEGGIFGPEVFKLDGIDPRASTFEPVSVRLRDPVAAKTKEVEVIGVIEFGASASFFGIYVSDETFRDLYGEPLITRYFVGLEDPDASKDVAREIEAALLPLGVQAESLKERVAEEQALGTSFFRLMQGFMGLGLFVGIAAVGVIAFRTVVERRQQIGMLRAIGYKRGTVALSFLLESTFIALLGVLSGIGLAIWLSFFLISSDEFPTSDQSLFIPWFQIAIIGGFAVLASLLMTYVPSRQAANVPIAEALRYE